MGVPTLVMDSNALPGFTNRQLARFVDKAALTFDESLKFFGKNGVVTGNPVRHEFLKYQQGKIRRFSCFGFQGSQGARAINNAMAESLEHLAKHRDRLTITHRPVKPIWSECAMLVATRHLPIRISSRSYRISPTSLQRPICWCVAPIAATCAEILQQGKLP